jgi:hypothetical protein
MWFFILEKLLSGFFNWNERYYISRRTCVEKNYKFDRIFTINNLHVFSVDYKRPLELHFSTTWKYMQYCVNILN